MVLPFSFFRGFELWGSSGFALVVFDVLAAEVVAAAAEEEDDEDSFFLVATPSTVFFFTLSLFPLVLSVFTLALAFGAFSFLALSG